MADVYFELLNVMKKEITPTPVSRTGIIGLSWASSGGEATAVFNEKYLAADGMENVVHVLEELDNGSFPDLEFIELDACAGGCVGGVMTVVNPFIAKARLRTLRRYLPVSQNWGNEDDKIPEDVIVPLDFEYTPVASFGKSREESMRMMSRMEEICAGLPDIDCGSCGAPTCRAFAADIVRGTAKLEDCPVLLHQASKKDQ